MPKLIQSFTEERRLPYLAMTLSALVAVIVIFGAHGTINRDGTLYIRAASLFAEGEWNQGFALYNWPFYSFLIAMGHQLTGLHLQTVAHLLAILFFSITGAMITLIVKEMGGNRDVRLCGLALLLTSPYLVGDIVPMVVREHGSWAALLSGLWCLMRFSKTFALKHAIGWGCAISLATLFRIEGLVFLLVLPVSLMFVSDWPWRRRVGLYVKANIVLWLTLCVLMVFFCISPKIRLEELGRLGEPLAIVKTVWFELTHGLSLRADRFATYVIGNYLEHAAMAGLLLTLGWVLVMKVLGAAGWAQSLIILKGAIVDRQRLTMPQPVKVIFLAFMLLSILIAVFILMSRFLLSARMVAPLAFGIFLVGAFALKSVFQESTTKGQQSKVWFWLICTLLSGQFLKLIWPESEASRYELKAVHWVQAALQQSELVYYDTMRLRYYAGQYQNEADLDWQGLQKIIQTGEVSKFQYVVVHVSDKTPAHLRALGNSLGRSVKTFENGHGNYVYIFHNSAEQPKERSDH